MMTTQVCEVDCDGLQYVCAMIICAAVYYKQYITSWTTPSCKPTSRAQRSHELTLRAEARALLPLL
jgi:hypothetical protein